MAGITLLSLVRSPRLVVARLVEAIGGRGVLLGVLGLTLLVGCGPRGETKSLQEVLEIARQEYVELVRAEPSEELQTQLKELAKNLEDMVGANGVGSQTAQASGNVAKAISGLIGTAGYTSRASLGEILMQHRVLIGDATQSEVNPARIKLLVARTYSVLSSEMASTKFAVKPLPKAG